MPAITAAFETHRGKVRQGNEDTGFCDEEVGLYAVFDGMGGHNAGDVASSIARDMLHDFVRTHRYEMEPSELVYRGLEAASAAIYRRASEQAALRGMGTTAVVLYRSSPSTVIIANVGDSRAYRVRGGRLECLTRDHTVVADMVERGMLKPEEARLHPLRHALSRNLGARSTVTPDIWTLEIDAGDRFLLCSDGLTGFADEHLVRHMLTGIQDVGQASRQLVMAALHGGGGDNVTVVVADVGDWKNTSARPSLSSAMAELREDFIAAGVASGLCDSVVHAECFVGVSRPELAAQVFDAVATDLEQGSGLETWKWSLEVGTRFLDQGGKATMLVNWFFGWADLFSSTLEGKSHWEHEHWCALSAHIHRAWMVSDVAIARAVSSRIHSADYEWVIRDMATGSARLPSQVNIEIPDELLPPDDELCAAFDELYEDLQTRLNSAAADWSYVAHRAARDYGGDVDLQESVRDLLGTRPLSSEQIMHLFDFLDDARKIHCANIPPGFGGPVVAECMRRLSLAYMSLCHALAAWCIQGREQSPRVGVANSSDMLRNRSELLEREIVELEREIEKRSETMS